MIYLFMLCTAELASVSVQMDTTRVPKEHKHVPADTLWVEQCVMRKGMGL